MPSASRQHPFPAQAAGRRRELAVAFGLALGPAAALGLGRFAYALLLPSMRGDLHWSFATAGAMNTANAVGYLAGALAASTVARRCGVRRGFVGGLGVTVVSLLATAGTGDTAALVALRALSGVSGAITFITGASIVADAVSASPSRRAATLLGIYFAGGGAGIIASGLAIPALLSATSAASGWRWGWVLLAAVGVVALGVALPAALASREPLPPPVADRHWPVGQLVPLLVCYGLFGAGYIAYMTFIVAFLQSGGAGAREITTFWVVLGVSSIASVVAWAGPISRLRGGRGPAVLMCVVAAGALLPIVSRSSVATVGSALLFGGSFLSVVTAVTAVVRRSLLPHHWTSAIAGITVAFALGQCLGPVLSGVLSDGPAGLSAGMSLSVALLLAGSFVALAQRHRETPSWPAQCFTRRTPISSDGGRRLTVGDEESVSRASWRQLRRLHIGLAHAAGLARWFDPWRSAWPRSIPDLVRLGNPLRWSQRWAPGVGRKRSPPKGSGGYICSEGGHRIVPVSGRVAMEKVARQSSARRESHRRRKIAGRRSAAVSAVAIGALFLGACGGGSADGPHSSSSVARATGSSATTAVSTPHSRSAAAVLAAYRAGWAAFEQALADANPEDPELAATMVDPQLQQVKANLLADQREGMVGRGTTTLHPKVTALSATSATVVDCAYSTAELVYQATGKPVPPVTPPENDGVTSTLVLSGGTWKVYKQIVTDGKCAPGS